MKKSVWMFFIFVCFMLLVGFVSASWFGDFFGGITGKVTISQSNNITFVGNYSGFYDFPISFFNGSNLTYKEIVKVTDAQYLALKDMHNGVKPYDFERIEYQEDLYGSTMPNGLKLGLAASPVNNNGHHSWDVMAHEQGHNFFSFSPFYYSIATPYPFLQESLAVLSASYTQDFINKNNISLGISRAVLNDMNIVFREEDSYQKNMSDKYILNGKNFNISDTLTSQALDWQMIQYGKQYGFDKYKRVSKMFEDSSVNKFTFQNDGASAEEQSTFIIAVLNVAFGKDFRQDFRNLNFPINETLYTQIYPILSSTVNNQSGKTFLTCQKSSNYMTSWSRNSCNQTDCGKDGYLKCEKRSYWRMTQYREVCQKILLQNSTCSLKPVCFYGYSVLNRMSC